MYMKLKTEFSKIKIKLVIKFISGSGSRYIFHFTYYAYYFEMFVYVRA
jgi:hypothetical protein